MGTQEETGVLDRFAGMPSSRGPSVSGAGGNGHTALLMSDFAAPDEEPVGWLESEDLKWSKKVSFSYKDSDILSNSVKGFQN